MILEKKLYSRANRIRNIFKVAQKVFPYFWKMSFSRVKEDEYMRKEELGSPALTVKEDGTLRCTSCMLCQNICPSHCISIEKASSLSEEEPPLSFDISILRCTFCSLCEEVCPVDAIRMSGPMPLGGHSEQNWVWDKDYLSTYAGELKSIVGEDRPLLPN